MMVPIVYHGAGVWKNVLETKVQPGDRVWVVTDCPESADRVSDLLSPLSPTHETFRVTVPSLVSPVVSFPRQKPDVVIGLGGGHALDVAKCARALCEDPEKVFRNRPFAKNTRTQCNHRIPLLCIPTNDPSSTTGAEMTPFAMTHMSGRTRVVDHALRPDVAIVDSDYVNKDSGASRMDALAHAIESYTSEFANDYTQGYSLRAARLLFRGNGPDMDNAPSLAGIGLANAWNGRADSLALTLAREYHVPPGVTNAIVLPHVIRACLRRSDQPPAVQRYAELAVYCGLADPTTGGSFRDMAERLVDGFERLRRELGLPDRLRDLEVFRSSTMERETVALLACYDCLQFGFVQDVPSVDFFRQMISEAY